MQRSARCAAVFSTVFFAGKVGLAGEPANTNPLNLTADVIIFIDHKARCKSFTNKDGLNCDELASEEAALRQQYQSDARLLSLIGGDYAIVIKRVPVHFPPFQVLPDRTIVPDTETPKP